MARPLLEREAVNEDEVGGWHDDPCRARWGCFLPDLTRLASGSSTTNLPRRHIGNNVAKCKPSAEKTASFIENKAERNTVQPFTLDERLGRDSESILKLGLCDLRLARDSRWPWLILVPQRPEVSEIFDLTPLDQAMLTFEQVTVGTALKKATGAEKINIAAIGNIVRQLHVHVVARSENDPNWPGPIWGFGQSVPYEEKAFEAMKHRILEAFQ